MVDRAIVEEPNIVFRAVDSQRLLLDSYLPHSGQVPRPAVILIHGGGMREPARALAGAGCAAFAIDYRLVDAASGRNRWPAQLDDAQAAVRWVRVHAAAYGIDPHRLAAYGWSAGGQLAALLGTRESRLDADGPSYSSRVNRVVVLAGDVDLAAYTEPPARDEAIALLGGTLTEVPTRFRDASPLSWIDAETVPFLIVHGLGDDTVPIDQSRCLVAALRAGGIPTRYLELDGIGHHDLSWERIGPHVLAFLREMETGSDGGVR